MPLDQLTDAEAFSNLLGFAVSPDDVEYPAPKHRPTLDLEEADCKLEGPGPDFTLIDRLGGRTTCLTTYAAVVARVEFLRTAPPSAKERMEQKQAERNRPRPPRAPGAKPTRGRVGRVRSF